LDFGAYTPRRRNKLSILHENVRSRERNSVNTVLLTNTISQTPFTINTIHQSITNTVTPLPAIRKAPAILGLSP
jgi:hypothetical protein